MKTTLRFALVIQVLTALTVVATPQRAEAQEIFLEGPLANAPACRNCILYREGRFSIAPMISFTFLDDYRRHIFFGGRLQYNITDWLAVGIAGAGAVPIDTALADEVANKAPNGIESNRANFPFAASEDGARSARENTTDLLGRILGFVSAELTFIPFRGKLGLFSRLFLSVDLYFFAGYAVPFVDERADVDCRTAEFAGRPGGQDNIDPDGDGNYDDWDEEREELCHWIASGASVPRTGTRVAVGAGTYGVGVSIYTNNWLSVNLEYRVMPFLWNHTGTDERGMMLQDDVLTFCPSDSGATNSCNETGEFPDHRINENDRIWTVNHMFSIGATFHFPFTPRRSE